MKKHRSVFFLFFCPPGPLLMAIFHAISVLILTPDFTSSHDIMKINFQQMIHASLLESLILHIYSVVLQASAVISKTRH